ncbi:axin isoform X3 [Tribolium madens]|uniref:axin isoform X3 n=1 Tax=Tribolium madens TaxID=41895 RepID=UPI001CF74862|nr:axin isoform X3 [Tribolium madens]
MNDREKARSSGKQQIYEGTFDYTLPRPPALGEERAYNASERGAQPLQMDRRHYKSSSPVPKFDYDDGSSYRPSSRHGKPPAYLAWAESLHNLLQDSDGVKLFLRYLESEGPHYADTLRFWFACEGLKNHDQVENIQKLVKLIYKTYFLKSALQINDDLKKQIMKNLKSPQCLEPPITLFDEAQAQIENLISKTTYPNFLKSDIYLQYVQSVENASSDDFNSESSSSSSSLSNKDLGNLASGLGPLPTLHEDMEFSLNSQQPLLLTPGTASVSTGYHTPTVRLTKDMLLRSQKHRALDIRPKSETYAGDGRSGRSYRKSVEEKQMRQFTARNKEINMNQRFIPRTQRMDMSNNKCLPIEEHAAILIKKLENLKREQENEELFHRRLKEGNSLSSLDDKLKTRDIESSIQFQDDNDQDILDEHVSRVFSDHSLSISPGLVSPKVSSPPRGRWSQSRTRRHDKDMFSIFSGDSGNVHDFAESSERLPKSKSCPEYNDDRFSRATSCRRSTKKTLTELTDSGVSVVSDTISVVPVAKDTRVLTWLMESDRSGKTAPSHAHSEMAVGKKYAKKYGSRSNSLERPGPAQPFIADPSMPPLPSPNTDIQLEEIRRRLTEDDGGRRSKQRSSKYYPEIAQSGQSTLRKSIRGQKDVTIVVFSFCDEQFPYRTKIPGSQITLRQFKEYLPKKGNYRFFFKTVCEDQVTHEEVSNDSEVLPLWEGKIMAQVKPID